MKKYFYLSLLFLSFAIVFSACGEASTEAKDVKNNRENFEKGNVDSPEEFFEGIVAEFVSVQSKFVKLYDCEGCIEAAEELRTRCNKSLRSLKNANSVGVGGSTLKDYAQDYVSACLDVANARINEDDNIEYFIDLLSNAEDEYVDYQSVYASNNGFRIGGTIDPDQDFE